MRISDNQVNEVKKLLSEHAVVHVEPEIEESPRATDGPMIKQLTESVMGMPDREDMITELKAKIEAGQYNPTGDEIAEAMIRRAIADNVR